MRMFIPFEKLEIGTPSSTVQVINLVGAAVEPLSFLRVRKYGKPFAGRVSETSFHVRPVIAGQTSFSPEITGRIVSDSAGTRLDIEVTPNVAVLTMIAVLAGFLGQLSFYRGVQVFILAGCGLGLCWLLAMTGFWLDRGHSCRLLDQLLKKTAGTDSAETA